MDRAERRDNTKKKQKSRLQKYTNGRYMKKEDMSESAIGRFKDTHFGCGCWMCKPEKLSGIPKMTQAELRARAQELEYKYSIEE